MFYNWDISIDYSSQDYDQTLLLERLFFVEDFGFYLDLGFIVFLYAYQIKWAFLNLFYQFWTFCFSYSRLRFQVQTFQRIQSQTFALYKRYYFSFRYKLNRVRYTHIVIPLRPILSSIYSFMFIRVFPLRLSLSAIVSAPSQYKLIASFHSYPSKLEDYALQLSFQPYLNQ